jgi:hypothetical protein
LSNRILLINADGSGEPQVLNDVPWSWFANFWLAESEEE